MGIMVLDVKNDKRRRKFKFDVECCNREDHIYINKTDVGGRVA